MIGIFFGSVGTGSANFHIILRDLSSTISFNMASLREYVPPSNSLTNKTVLITGGSAGIGKWNVKQFALLKPKRLFVLGRNPLKTQAVIDAVRAETGFEGIHFVVCDTSSFKSVKSAVKRFFKLTGDDPELHLLVCNAGTSVMGENKTADGYELLWQTNYLSHFLLTELLLPTIKKTAEKEGRAPGSVRVVNVSSIGHLRATGIDYEQTRNFPVYTPREAIAGPYSLSKFAQVVDTKRRAEELKEYGIMVYSLHPGPVDTEIWGKGGITDPEKQFSIKLISDELGSLTTLYLSTASDEVLSHSGSYYDQGQLADGNPKAEEKNLQIELKEKSLEQVKDWLE
ncbi:hypothetical protein BJ742DRAFT_812125 [Cladochytrium replicatum]|nr:hypothetical protein BJ742DRAFT_812125 [Cladochytrium replicatum]